MSVNIARIDSGLDSNGISIDNSIVKGYKVHDNQHGLFIHLNN